MQYYFSEFTTASTFGPSWGFASSGTVPTHTLTSIVESVPRCAAVPVHTPTTVRAPIREVDCVVSMTRCGPHSYHDEGRSSQSGCLRRASRGAQPTDLSTTHYNGLETQRSTGTSSGEQLLPLELRRANTRLLCVYCDTQTSSRLHRGYLTFDKVFELWKRVWTTTSVVTR